MHDSVAVAERAALHVLATQADVVACAPASTLHDPQQPLHGSSMHPQNRAQTSCGQAAALRSRTIAQGGAGHMHGQNAHSQVICHRGHQATYAQPWL